MRLLYCFLFCFYSYLGCSQNLYGTITSDKGIPIKDAEIIVKNEINSSKSDEKGKFKIQPSTNTATLIILAEGYKTQTIQHKCLPNVNCTISIQLQRHIQHLKPVTLHLNKRIKDIIKTSASVSKLTSKTIKETQTWALEDLNSIIPNYAYSDLGVSYQQQIALRGITAFSETPSIATYIDGVNTFNISGNNLLLTDIKSIEILRGAQGARFGRDAIGGIINITTKKPNNSTSLIIENTIGNQGLQCYATSYKTPLIKNKLYIGVAGKYNYQHGFYKNNLTGKTTFNGESLTNSAVNGRRLGDTQSMYGNIDIKLKANKNLHFLLNLKYQNDQSIGASAFYQAALTPKKAFKNPYEFSVNATGKDERQVFNTSLSSTYHLKTHTLKSNTYYSNVSVGYYNIDGDITPFDFFNVSTNRNNELGTPYPMQVVGQEIRLISGKNKLSWELGGFGFFEKNDKQIIYIGKRLTQEHINFQKNYGLSGFGKLNYALSKSWHLETHLRYDNDIKNTYCSVIDVNKKEKTTTQESITKRKLFSALSPKFSLSYIPNSNKNAYVSYSKGFRSGGINNTFSEDLFSSYNAEFSNTYELGYKWHSKNNNYMVATTAYWLHWEDMQLYYYHQQVDRPDKGGVWLINNIGHVKSYGLETEISAKPFTNFQVDYALGINRGRYLDFDFLGKNIANNKTILSPDFTSFLGIQHLFTLSKKKQLIATLRGEWRVTGNQYFDLINTIQQPTYHLFNSNLILKHKDISVTIWAKNMLNKTYINFSMPGQFKATILNRPRTFGIGLTYTPKINS